jgi:hypothetical protein
LDVCNACPDGSAGSREARSLSRGAFRSFPTPKNALIEWFRAPSRYNRPGINTAYTKAFTPPITFMVGEVDQCAPLKKILQPKNLQGFFLSITTKSTYHIMASVATVTLPLPALPSGWAADKDFKAVGKLSEATQRSIEPVGPHFLAHARRARHKRTFSEDDRIQAQESAKNVEDGDVSDESEDEDPMMLQREAKDWKVCGCSDSI